MKLTEAQRNELLRLWHTDSSMTTQRLFELEEQYIRHNKADARRASIHANKLARLNAFTRGVTNQ